MAEDGTEDDGGEGFLLIEGRLLGRVLFPFAMAEIERVPPANDTEPDPSPPGDASA